MQLRRHTGPLRRFASEPLLHFTLLGALVFAGHRLITRTPDEHVIEVSMSKQRELGKLFEQRRKQPPSEEDRRQLLQRYVEDEVLYREGLRIFQAQSDPVLRAQVIARFRGMLQSELAPNNTPTDDE